MRKPIESPRRIWHHYPCVLPADVLSDEPTYEDDLSSLREEASCDGYCYLILTRSFGDGTYLVHVAASLELLRNQGYTLVLNEVQLTKARPWHDHLMKSAWTQTTQDSRSSSAMPEMIHQPDKLEAFCSSCPAPEDVTAWLAQLRLRLVFQMEAFLPPACSELTRLPAQFHYEHVSGLSLIYLAGEDSESEDGERLPAHQSRFWAYPGSDAKAFGWITRRVARHWSFRWRRVRSSQAHPCADVA